MGLHELTAARDQLQQEIDGQTGKIDRAQQAADSARQRAEEAGIDVTPEAPASLEVEARNLKEQNQSVLNSLNNALQDQAVEDVQRLFQSLCVEHQLQLSSRPPSAGSSRPSSRGGSSGGGYPGVGR